MMTDPLPPIPVPALLRQHGLRPDKSLGQNFLIDESALQKVCAAGEIQAQDYVLEIGPGLGSLTRHLARAARQVIAVELDGSLIPPLHTVLEPFDNVQVVEGDILAQNPAELLPETSYLVVANIPYYITSAVIRHLLEAENQPRRMVLTVQEEVARRICEQPPKMSILALSVQVYGHPVIVTRIPAGAFYPAPKVDSAVVRIDLYPQPKIPAHELDTFFRLIKAGFSQKRKTLRNAISAGMAWTKTETTQALTGVDIDPQRRAETLDLTEWGRLTAFVHSSVADR